MRVRVLESAAGGGFPEWNSNPDACRPARAGNLRALPRPQASEAVRTVGHEWSVLIASPDLRQQIDANAAHSVVALRSSPIAGLLTLRERQPSMDLATATDVVKRRIVALNTDISLEVLDGGQAARVWSSMIVPSDPLWRPLAGKLPSTAWSSPRDR
jgi:pyrroloquinoline quinone biosynthesis protein B